MAAAPNGTSASGAAAETGEAGSSRDKLQRWVKRLGTLPSLALPTDYPRPSESTLSGSYLDEGWRKRDEIYLL